MAHKIRVLQTPIRCMSTASSKFSVRDYKIHKLDSGPSTEVELSRDDGLKMFSQMVKIRRMEAAANSLYKEKIIRGFGMDVSAVREATGWAREYCRSVQRPMVLETTHRYFGQSTSDPGTEYIKNECQKEVDEVVTQVKTDPGIDRESDQLYRYLWIKCTGHEVEVLDSYEQFLKLTAHHLGVNYVKTEVPFRTIKRKTMLASRHVHKKYRVQYEIRNYYRHLLFKNMTGSTVDTFLEYVERNIPEGVLFLAEKHRLGELPFELGKSQDK